ncbi:uncharacterized protein [Aegilops tauschii subsp. strangulata]|uniref:uncharacterized protein n=1 Tax=Aegilops tauschii subsp. strangulata TaxID=200361 RepID=UPI00098BA931|nr:uncharacterized protein LOC109771072 [Aegilops tauschii subsp. strangulata]
MPSAAAPLEDDDLLSEILLLLPPLPSSLPRASLVCRRWRCLVSAPGFVRRFHAHHRSKVPLLGFFAHSLRDVSFLPALDAPNCVPSGLLSRKIPCSNHFWTLDCRHGLVLVFLRWQNQFMVWDSVSDDQHHIDVPLGFGMGAISGAVVRAAGLVQHFQVVLVGPDKKRRGLACVFSSKTGAWERILKFDLDRQGLTMVTLPPLSFHDRRNNTHFRVMRAEGGGLGFLFISGFTAELWRKIDFDGVASWMLERTIELDKLALYILLEA